MTPRNITTQIWLSDTTNHCSQLLDTTKSQVTPDYQTPQITDLSCLSETTKLLLTSLYKTLQIKYYTLILFKSHQRTTFETINSFISRSYLHKTLNRKCFNHHNNLDVQWPGCSSSTSLKWANTHNFAKNEKFVFQSSYFTFESNIFIYFCSYIIYMLTIVKYGIWAFNKQWYTQSLLQNNMVPVIYKIKR